MKKNKATLIRLWLEKDILSRAQVEQVYDWLTDLRDEADDLEVKANDLSEQGRDHAADRVTDAANDLYDEWEELFELAEAWVETHETFEDINDPALYVADLFGNPIRRE